MKVEVIKKWVESKSIFAFYVYKDGQSIEPHLKEEDAIDHAKQIIETYKLGHPKPEVIFSQEVKDGN